MYQYSAPNHDVCVCLCVCVYVCVPVGWGGVGFFTPPSNFWTPAGCPTI